MGTLERKIRLFRVICVVAALNAMHLLTAQVTGVSFTVSPTFDWMLWERNAGLRDNYMVGGRLGIGFGQYIELHAGYSYGNNFTTDFNRLQGGDVILSEKLSDLPSQRMTTEQYGFATKLHLGGSTFVPYLTGGAGFIRMGREGIRTSESIYITGGGGFLVSVSSRYNVFLEANHMGYRYNPGSTFLSGADLNRAGLQPGNFRQVLVTNWKFQGGIKGSLGGRTYGEPFQSDIIFLDEYTGGLGNSRLTVQTMFGQINFEERVGLAPNQQVVGVSVGLDFGPHINIQSFYWRGISDDNRVSVEDLHLYGGEFSFTFFRANLSPYVLLGGGYLHVGDTYRPAQLARPSSQVFGLTGAGLQLDFSHRFSIGASIRALLTTRDGVDNALSPSKVELSPMYSLIFQVGLGNLVRSAERRQPRDRLHPRRITELPQVREAEHLTILREAALSAEIARALTRGDTLVAAELMRERDELRRTLMRTYDPIRDRREDRTITVPVPEEGEIYIRFGRAPEYPLTATPLTGTDPLRRLEERIESLIRDRVQAAPAPPGILPEEMLERRLQLFEQRLVDIIDSRLAQVQIREPQERIREFPAADVTRTGELSGLSAYGGFNLLRTPFQFLVGVKGDYGVLLGGRIELLPEIVMGFGGGTNMYNVNANALFRLPPVRYVRPFDPYVGVGVGLMAFSSPPENIAGLQFVWLFLIGGDHTVGPGKLFMEYANLNLFGFNRLNIGYRYRFRS